MASLTHPAIVSFAAFEWGSLEEMKRAFSWPLMVLVLSKYHLRALIGQCNLSSGEWSDRAAIKTGSGVKCADWFLSSMREDKNVNPPDSLRRYAGSMRHAWIQPPLRPDASCMRKAVLTERFRKEALAIGSKGACDRCPRTLGRSQTGFKGQMHHHNDLGSKCAYTCHLSNKTTRKSVLLSTPQIWLMKVSKKLA